MTLPESPTSADLFDQIQSVHETFDQGLMVKETGTVKQVNMGVAAVSGLPGVGAEELIKFPGDVYGMAFNIDEDELGVFLLDNYAHLMAGDEVERTHRVMSVGVGYELLGRVIDPLGRPLDDRGHIAAAEYWPVERPAPSITSRLPVTEPLQTGVKVIDALVPIGRGQRELILGDRQTGKTALAVNAIINQRDKGVICVYCAIGQRAASVAQVIDTLKENDALSHTVVVVTEGNNTPGLKYIAPYAATTIAEYFMHKGKDTLIIYDDLTHHARAYRELSLLLRRPPGREAYPGDIFYIHSRLLERSTHLDESLGGGSMTALPIMETEEENMSAYIPTNLISITDGQVYLSPRLFSMGVLPAVDVGKSVSRVGGKAQLPVYRQIAGDLKLDYAQFEELESFARFGTKLDERTTDIIEQGRRIRACLKQTEVDPVSVPTQLLILLALTEGLFKGISLNQIQDAVNALSEVVPKIPLALVNKIYEEDKLDQRTKEKLLEIAAKALVAFDPSLEK